MDGIDAAILYTNGDAVERFGPSLTIAYTPETRELVKVAIQKASACGMPDNSLDAIHAAEMAVTDLHAEAVTALLAQAKLDSSAVDLIGFHGQTIAHRPDLGWTWQIGCGARLAAATGIPVVNDLRSNDMAGGGQGAPLVPIFHAAMLKRDRRHDTIAVLNIGGVANVTWVSFKDNADEPHITAFDTGPGNAMLDDWAEVHTGIPCDTDGMMSARGTMHDDILMGLMASPYFDEAPPKTLDRDDYSIQAVRGLSADDGAATITAFIVESVVAAQEHFAHPPDIWYVCGGGRHNPTLMRRLRRRFPVIVDPVEVLGWHGDALEAEAFAYLAVRSVRGLPLSLPSTTGTARPASGGTLYRP